MENTDHLSNPEILLAIEPQEAALLAWSLRRCKKNGIAPVTLRLGTDEPIDYP